MSFDNMVVIITGASFGIGAVMALEFAKASAKLTLVGRNVDNLNKIAERCETFHNLKPLVVGADMKVDGDLEKIISETIAEFNQIDVLINNAATDAADIPRGKYEKATMEQFDSAMSTNVRAVFYLTQLAIPHLIASKGNVINISSIAAKIVTPGYSIYSVTKAALNHFTRCVALELGSKGVRVNTVSSGATIAKMVDELLSSDYKPEMKLPDSFTSQIPMRKMGTSEEIAALVMFVASDAAKSVTGATYVVDNGSALTTLNVPEQE